MREKLAGFTPTPIVNLGSTKTIFDNKRKTNDSQLVWGFTLTPIVNLGSFFTQPKNYIPR